MQKINKSQNRGITLIHMALIVMILGIMGAAALSQYKVYKKQHYFGVNKTRMAVIKDAIANYVKLNHYFPCPANPALPPNSPYYGVSLSDLPYSGASRSCWQATNPSLPGGMFRIPAANGHAGENVTQGSVPVRSLGLTDDYLAEPDGRLFIYAVTEYITGPTAGSGPYGMSVLGGIDKGGIDIQDPVQTGHPSLIPPISAGCPGRCPPTGCTSYCQSYGPGTALYVLISPGLNPVGAWTLQGVQAYPCTYGGTTYDTQNCNTTRSMAVYYGGTDGYSDE